MADADLTNSWRKVTEPAAAAMLTDARARAFLEPFLEASRTMSEVADLLSLRLNVVHYRVGRLLRLGLLQTVGHRKGKGRRAVLYGPTASAFFVPFEATPHLSLEQMLHHLGALDAFVKSAARSLSEVADEWGVLVSHRPGEGVVAHLAPLNAMGAPTPITAEAWLRPDLPALLAAESFLRLSPRNAKAFQRDMMELVHAYAARSTAAGQLYMAVLGLAPVTES